MAEMKQNHNDVRFVHRVHEIIQEAGEILLLYFQKPHLEKKEKIDQGWVTEADLASEQFLKKELARLLPEASFNAEESGIAGDAASDYCWVIDPLDGTTNFVLGIPYFCISIALTYQGESILGVVYQPITKELISACKGQGLFLNGKKLDVTTRHAAMKKSIVVVGVPYAKNEWFTKVLDGIRVVAPATYAFRHLGAAALDLAYVAIGRLDGVFLANLAWWDVAAGMLLVQESGGIVTDFEGKKVDNNYKTLIASSVLLHSALINMLTKG